VFSRITAISAQTDLDAQRLVSLGAAPDRVTVSGSLKYDQELPHGHEEQSAELKKQIGAQRPVWIAASTHPGEEDQVLAAHKQILEICPDCLLILVPRHPERFEEVYKLCEAYSMDTSRRSSGESPDGQVYLVDTMGDLMLCYGAADVAFVAGSLTPVGGHNLLEPASLGLPVLMGPYTFKIEKIFQVFLDEGAAFCVNDSNEIVDKILFLFEHDRERLQIGDKAKNLVRKNQGAAESQLQTIKSLCSK
jgi:3-deoxy-D-manno-octulosonic-acid transferase